MNTLAVTPEMFGQKPLTAPNVIVAASLVEQPEDVGFDFYEYYDMLRGVGVTAEDIASSTILYSDEATSDLGKLINEVTIHETGHFQHDVRYPKHTRNMRLLGRCLRRIMYIPMAEGLGLAAYGASIDLAAPVVAGSLALLVAGTKGVDYYNPRERPAFRFEQQQENRKIVDFGHKAP